MLLDICSGTDTDITVGHFKNVIINLDMYIAAACSLVTLKKCIYIHTTSAKALNSTE